MAGCVVYHGGRRWVGWLQAYSAVFLEKGNRWTARYYPFISVIYRYLLLCPSAILPAYAAVLYITADGVGLAGSRLIPPVEISGEMFNLFNRRRSAIRLLPLITVILRYAATYNIARVCGELLNGMLAAVL